MRPMPSPNLRSHQGEALFLSLRVLVGADPLITGEDFHMEKFSPYPNKYCTLLSQCSPFSFLLGHVVLQF